MRARFRARGPTPVDLTPTTELIPRTVDCHVVVPELTDSAGSRLTLCSADVSQFRVDNYVAIRRIIGEVTTSATSIRGLFGACRRPAVANTEGSPTVVGAASAERVKGAGWLLSYRSMP